MNIDPKKVHVRLHEITFDLKSWGYVTEKVKQDYGVVSLAEAYKIFADFCKKYPDAALISELGAFDVVEGNMQVDANQIERKLRLTAKMPFTTSY